MSKKTTWAHVKKGVTVELGGRQWLVVKIKPKGKTAKVVVEYKGRSAESVVKLTDRVTIVPVLDETTGRANRWATKAEAAEYGVALKAGDATVTKPPAKAKGGSWEKPVGKAEKMVTDLLSARLVAETDNEEKGYYVPPVDVSTVASHLVFFHAYTPPEDEDEGSMLAYHAERHALALRGEPLAVNHWHTAKRPRFE
jgi:hypothetical protein